MSSIKLLDCTVRDGGYLNDWKFGSCVLTETVQRLINANVDYVELGFIDDRRYYDENKSIFPNTKTISETYKHVKPNNKTKFVAMIDYGTCDIKNIQKHADTILYGIRVIFKKEKMNEALAYCKQIKDLGYAVFTQLVSTTAYEKEDFTKLISLENELMPMCVSIVDTYGLMDFDELESIFEVLDAGLDKNISIGFHAHNNLQFAFSNTIQFASISSDRARVIDGTLMGMGKSAGNAPIELVANYCNNKLGLEFNINELLEGVDSNIMKLFGRNNWGYSMKFLLSSINRVHPNYVNDYISKDSLSISDLNDCLKRISEDKKLLYDKNESESNFNSYCSNRFDDKENVEHFSSIIGGKKVLLLGPGTSVEAARDKIQLFIENENPIIISINYLSKIRPNYVFISNSRRLGYLANDFEKIYACDAKVIATSNLTPYFKKFDLVFNFQWLIDTTSFAKDSAMIMILKLLEKCQCKNVFLAGFDGYASSFADDFVNISNSHGWKEPYPGFLNSYIRGQIKQYRENMNVIFLTSSLFEEED